MTSRISPVIESPKFRLKSNDNEIHIDKISRKENNENINFIDVITINKGNFDV